MLDTIRLRIPLSEHQWRKSIEFVAEADRWHWAMHNPKSGDILLRHYNGSLPHNFESHHREIRFTVDPRYKESDCACTIEFSLPKSWYGHNISLLYNWQPALSEIRDRLNEQIGLKRRGKLCNISDWIVQRCDTCYAWRFPDQRTAQAFLDSLKGLKYPYKSPVIYPTSIFFKGATYSLKFYLKYPEFRKHDLREMIKQGSSLEWVEHLERQALGVLRCEATLRAKFLRRQGINTVADLAAPHREWLVEPNDLDDHQARLAQFALLQIALKDGDRELHDGEVLRSEMPIRLLFQNLTVELPPCHATFKVTERATHLMHWLLARFVGDSPAMRDVDKVRILLSEKHKPIKVARLTSFWMYVRQFGTERAKQDFGKTTYYDSVADLKKAGIALLDEVKSGDGVDQAFVNNFTLSIPSPYVVNQFDDFRDHPNIIDFPSAK